MGRPPPDVAERPLVSHSADLCGRTVPLSIMKRFTAPSQSSGVFMGSRWCDRACADISFGRRRTDAVADSGAPVISLPQRVRALATSVRHCSLATSWLQRAATHGPHGWAAFARIRAPRPTLWARRQQSRRPPAPRSPPVDCAAPPPLVFCSMFIYLCTSIPVCLGRILHGARARMGADPRAMLDGRRLEDRAEFRAPIQGPEGARLSLGTATRTGRPRFAALPWLERVAPLAARPEHSRAPPRLAESPRPEYTDPTVSALRCPRPPQRARTLNVHRYMHAHPCMSIRACVYAVLPRGPRPPHGPCLCSALLLGGGVTGVSHRWADLFVATMCLPCWASPCHGVLRQLFRRLQAKALASRRFGSAHAKLVCRFSVRCSWWIAPRSGVRGM